MKGISYRPAIVSDQGSDLVYAADQLICGECGYDYWCAFHLVGGNTQALECQQCGTHYSYLLAELVDEPKNALADYNPGNRGIYGGGD